VRGDAVWIYVKYAGTARTGLEPAVIAWVSEKELRYYFQNQEADLRGTTGAPILAADGRVVGMHLGVFTAASGRKFGYACPSAAMLAVVAPGRPKPATVLKPEGK
jgi:hypothetical protein